MSPKMQHIAVAGATGNLGKMVLSTLLTAGYPVTVLTRIGSKSSQHLQHKNLTVRSVDYDSVASIASALSGVAVVVSCFPTSGPSAQNPLIDAAVAAGVTRFIPADFGMDMENKLTQQLPVCVPRVKTYDYLNAKVAAHPQFSWTAIANGPFFDWGLQVGSFLNPSKHTATLFNGGNVTTSVTTLGDIAKAVIGVVEHQDETKNRIIHIQSASVTQNQLIQYAKEYDGKEWTISYKSTEELLKESYTNMENGNEEAAMFGFCIVATSDPNYGCDFSGRLWNDIVGVKEMNEEEVKKLVQSVL